MRSLYFLIAVLAALAMCCDAAAVAKRDVTSRSNLYQGSWKPGDRRLVREYHYRAPQNNIIHHLWVWYWGNKALRFSLIQVTEVGTTQWATPRIIEGGVGSNNVTILMSSAVSRGFHYLVEIWGQ